MSESDSTHGDGQYGLGDALDKATTVDARARRHGRWAAWTWLGLGTVMPAHLLGTQLGEGTWVESAAAWLIPVAVVVIVVYSALQRAESRVMGGLVWPVTWSFVALVFLDVILAWTVLADGPAALVVLFGLLPAVPPFYGAWRVLRG